MISISIDADILERMIAMDMLSPDQRTDRVAVGAAVLQCVRAGSSTTSVHAFLGTLAEELRQELCQRRPNVGRWGWKL